MNKEQASLLASSIRALIQQEIEDQKAKTLTDFPYFVDGAKKSEEDLVEAIMEAFSEKEAE